MKQTTRRSQITVPIADKQQYVVVDRRLLRRAVKSVLRGAGVRNASISVALVDDQTIARVNWDYLRHRGPTDVLSFLLDDRDPRGTRLRVGAPLDGEVIVGAETALRAAPRYGWRPHDELLLYVIHGTLHLVGLDDRTPRQRAKMQEREREVMQELGIELRS
jgi:probable rRNA maturation factor